MISGMPGSTNSPSSIGNAEDLAVGGGDDDHLVDQRFKGLDPGLRGFDLRLGDAEILARVAGDGLLVGETRLLQGALRNREFRGGAVEIG